VVIGNREHVKSAEVLHVLVSSTENGNVEAMNGDGRRGGYMISASARPTWVQLEGICRGGRTLVMSRPSGSFAPRLLVPGEADAAPSNTRLLLGSGVGTANSRASCIAAPAPKGKWQSCGPGTG